jgi:hypothetical protein
MPNAFVAALKEKGVVWTLLFVALSTMTIGAASYESLFLFLVSVVAILACVVLLLSPSGRKAWKWIKGDAVARVTLVLSISGAIGGLAFHLVHNHGKLFMIGLYKLPAVELVEGPPLGAADIDAPNLPKPIGTTAPTPAPTDTPAVEPTARSASPSSTPTASVGNAPAVNAADSAVSPSVSPSPSPTPTPTPTATATRSATPAQLYKRVNKIVFDFGFLADLLVGLIAANALHLAISGIVRYQDDESSKTKPGSSIFFTLIALGILAGFSGAKILPGLATTLDQLTPGQKQEAATAVKAQISQDPSSVITPDAAAELFTKALQNTQFKDAVRQAAAPKPTATPTPTPTPAPAPTATPSSSTPNATPTATPTETVPQSG